MMAPLVVSKPKQTSWQQRLAADDPGLRVHLLGIGGAGLSAIAQVLIERGIQVSGSDRQESERTRQLAAAGAIIYARQSPENLTGLPPRSRPDLVLISSAVAETNPERQAAEAMGLPVVKRRTFLGPFLAERDVIAVAGTHGKSTTTAMIVQMLHENGRDAGFIVGADIQGLGSARAGRDRLFVIEADEYDYMFHGLTPTLAVVTNVEWDHPDCYPTADSFTDAFRQFLGRVHPAGWIVSCRDDPGAERLRQDPTMDHANWRTYGLGPNSDVQAVAAKLAPSQDSAVSVLVDGVPAGKVRLQLPGVHVLRNSLAAVAVAEKVGIPLDQALTSLGRFRGIARRFELRGEQQGVTVIDDYAHHPTEVLATLAAARERFPDRRIWAVFQPHTFSRTGMMLHEMAASFANADLVLVTDIYAARETDDGTLSAADVVAASTHPAIRHSGDLAQTSALLREEVRPGDVVLTLGAGTSDKIGEMLLAQLRKG